MKLKLSKLKYLILLILPVFLYGCGETTPSTTPTPTPTTSTQGTIVLRWWGIYETKADVQPLIDKYLSQNPQIRNIEYIQKPINGDYADYVSTIDKAIVDKDQTPDIFMIHNTWAGKYANYVTKAPTDLINEAYFSDFYAITKKDFFRQGAIALPQSMDALAIIYDSNKLEAIGYSKPSTQWPDFKTLAQKLTLKDTSGKITQGGFSAGFYDNVQFRFDVINLLLQVNAVKMTDIQEKTATFYSPENKEDTERAIQFYNDFGTTTWSKDMKKDIAAFLEGNLAMYAAPSWRLNDILNYKKQYSLNLNVNVAQVPQLANYSAYWADYWGYTVSKTSPQSVEAWKFIKFLDENTNLKLFNETVIANGRQIGIIYPRKSMNSDMINDRYLGPYVASLEKADDWFMYDGFKMKNAFELTLGASNNLSNLSGLQSSATSIISGR